MISQIFRKAFKPFRLASLLTTYILGLGLVQYVRSSRNWGMAVQGVLFLIFIVFAVELLRENQLLQHPNNWPQGHSPEAVRRLRWVLGLIIATFLTAALTIFIDWMMRTVLWQGLVLLLLGFLILCGFYFLGDIKEGLRPYQSLIEIFLFVVLPPAVAFFIQSKEPHRLLTLVVIGLIPIYLAYRLLAELKTYRQDLKYEINTAVTLIGWEKAMVAHNALILLAYLIFAFITLLGFPWFILWPVFLTLPIGLVEIWLMERVRKGSKPLWKVMQFATACVFFIPIYLLGFAFWIR